MLDIFILYLMNRWSPSMEPSKVWDELDSYVEQVGVENVLCEENWLVNMLEELHGWGPETIRPHVISWLQHATRGGKP